MFTAQKPPAEYPRAAQDRELSTRNVFTTSSTTSTAG